MSSKLFREELERVVSDSLRDSGADGISNLLSDMMSVRQVSTYEAWTYILKVGVGAKFNPLPIYES